MASLVQYITYKGVKYPVRISYYAIKKFQEETGKDIQELDKDISLMETLLWYGLIAGHKSDNVPMSIEREEMEFMLDECITEFNDLFKTFFPVPEDINSESKKK